MARLFNLGYELDLTKCSENERKEIALQIKEYKEQRKWIHSGHLNYCEVPNENYLAWSVNSKEAEKSILIIMQKLFDPRYSHGRIRMSGLNPEWDYKEHTTGKVYSGDELMEAGVSVPLIKEDFYTFSMYFSKIEDEEDDKDNCQ